MGKLSFKDANDSNNNYKLTGGNTYSFMAGGFVGVEFFFFVFGFNNSPSATF